MRSYLKRTWYLTETGADGLVKSVWTYFFYYFCFVPPFIAVLMFADMVLTKDKKCPAFFLVFLAVSAVCMYVVTKINYNTTYNETYKESANMRIELTNHLSRLPMAFFSKHNLSDLSQSIMSDVAVLERALARVLGNVIGFVMNSIIVYIVMFFINYKLALCLVVPIIFAVIVVFRTRKRQLSLRDKHNEILRDVAENIQISIEMYQEIRNYGLVDKIKEKGQADLKKSSLLQWKSELTQGIPMALAKSITTLSIGLVVAVGVSLFMRGEVRLIHFIAFSIVSVKLASGFNDAFRDITQIFYTEAKMKYIGDIYKVNEEGGDSVTFPNFDIVLNKVEFSYNGDTKVINGVSFTAEQHKVTALVGPSGCGKTTILRLISKLYDYENGSIEVGGQDIKNINPECLFKHISIVFQDVVLFHTSVMENIRIGNIEASDEQVIEAARLSGCMEFIEKLPAGFNTYIGENGTKLSGGERQRISIARAILKDAPIIILDEISASLDAENEVKIQNSLNKLIKNKTVIIISHRLKSIENVDKIVVLDQGKVDGTGKHEELKRNSNVYRTLLEKSVGIENYKY